MLDSVTAVKLKAGFKNSKRQLITLLKIPKILICVFIILFTNDNKIG
jgi:hypothetical protein